MNFSSSKKDTKPGPESNNRSKDDKEMSKKRAKPADRNSDDTEELDSQEEDSVEKKKKLKVVFVQTKKPLTEKAGKESAQASVKPSANTVVSKEQMNGAKEASQPAASAAGSGCKIL
jgi:hypothetical protein